MNDKIRKNLIKTKFKDSVRVKDFIEIYRPDEWK